MELPPPGVKTIGVIVVEAPGCFSAGDTEEEAKANAKEALTLYLESLLEDEGLIHPPDTGASWDDFTGEGWEEFTVVVDSDEIERAVGAREAQKGRRFFERIQVKLHNWGFAANRKFRGSFKGRR